MEDPIKIIVTDDRPRWRETLRRELPPYNIRIIAEAEHGEALLKHLETLTPDVILLDLDMPVMDGNQTMYWLNKKYPEAKIIIMSLYDGAALMDDYVRRGVKGCISKGDVSDMRELVGAIRKVAKGGKHFNYERDLNPIDFTIRQKEIVNLYGKGKTEKEIAAELRLTTDAVRKQRDKIIDKLEVKTPREMLARILRLGLHFFRGPENKTKPHK